MNVDDISSLNDGETHYRLASKLPGTSRSIETDNASAEQTVGSLTNADFRRILMTETSAHNKQTVDSNLSERQAGKLNLDDPREGHDKKRQRRRYQQPRRNNAIGDYMEDDGNYLDDVSERSTIINSKYRDRAKERRENAAKEDTSSNAELQKHQYQQTQQNASTGAYRAVGPDALSTVDAAARRRQIIEESKFLGGDIDHTHLVKGLDYALLQKIRKELAEKESSEQVTTTTNEEDFDMVGVDLSDPSNIRSFGPTSIGSASIMAGEGDGGSGMSSVITEFKTQLGQNVYNTLFNRHDKTNKPEIVKNERLTSNRLAYIIDLDDSFSDFPTTLLRSKADCPDKNADKNPDSNVSTNDFVLQKLIEVLWNIRRNRERAVAATKKSKKKTTNEHLTDGDKPAFNGVNRMQNDTTASEPIYKDEELLLSASDQQEQHRITDSSLVAAGRSRNSSYFHQSSSECNKKRSIFPNDNFSSEIQRPLDSSSTGKGVTSGNTLSLTTSLKGYDIPKAYLTPAVKIPISKLKGNAIVTTASKSSKLNMTSSTNVDSYAECYPGTAAEEDVNIDSDDEPDYDKMDLGNRKGPVGRWDFDTQEEYSEYMSKREAMPKAAFQYGVKMADGRRTRSRQAMLDDKRKLDREWQQITQIIEKKRRGGAGGAEPSNAD